MISVTPSDSFSYKSEATWPSNNYDNAVKEGILEVLSHSGFPRLPVEVVLKEIGWRDTEYCYDSFYKAAKKAAAKILQEVIAS